MTGSRSRCKASLTRSFIIFTCDYGSACGLSWLAIAAALSALTIDLRFDSLKPGPKRRQRKHALADSEAELQAEFGALEERFGEELAMVDEVGYTMYYSGECTRHPYPSIYPRVWSTDDTSIAWSRYMPERYCPTRWLGIGQCSAKLLLVYPALYKYADKLREKGWGAKLCTVGPALTMEDADCYTDCFDDPIPEEEEDDDAAADWSPDVHQKTLEDLDEFHNAGRAGAPVSKQTALLCPRVGLTASNAGVTAGMCGLLDIINTFSVRMQ